MKIVVNGEPRDLPDGANLAEALSALGVVERGVAVERNRAIVPKSAYAATRLEDADQLEIVTFVGGG